MFAKQITSRRFKLKLIIGAIAVFSILALVIGFTKIYNTYGPAHASGISSTITPSTQNVSTLSNISVAFTTSGNLAIGQKIRLSYNSSYTGSLTTTNSTINTTPPSDVSLATASGIITATMTLANAISANSTVTIALNSALTTPVAAGNYAFAVSTDANDNSTSFQYVGQANVVQVTAYIPVSLALDIRNPEDTADTNVCDLGNQTTAAISSCSYRLKVTTNAGNGYAVAVKSSDGGLTNGSYSLIDAASGFTGSTIAAGSEVYGMTVNPGSITGNGGTIDTATPFTATSSGNIVNTNTPIFTNILSANKPNSPSSSGDTTNTSLITHKLATSSNTPPGIYTESMTYQVTPTF